MDSDDENDDYIIRAEREAKQNYLREEIIDLDYDSDLFMWYIEGIQEANIDAWAFEDLQECVRNFKAKYRPGETLQEALIKEGKNEQEQNLQSIKQKFLETEIIEQNYDAELFTWFIESIKEPDLSVWNFKDLEDTVRQFKLKFEPGVTLRQVMCGNYVRKHEEPKSREFKSGEFKSFGSVENGDRKVVVETKCGINFIEGEMDVEGERVGSKGKEDGENEKGRIRCISPLPVSKNLNSKGAICNDANNEEKIVENEFEATENNEEDKRINIEEDKVQETDEICEFNGQTQVIQPENPVIIEIWQCLQLPETAITLISDLKVTISEPTIIKTGFFSKKFIQYEVYTHSLNWHVQRRYNDFLWIRNLLLLTNPGSYIAPIPTKKSARNFSNTFIKKRQKFLTDFLNSILMDKTLRSSQDLIAFLSNNDAKSFEDYKVQRKTQKKLTKFEEISTLEGETLCNYEEDCLLFDCLNDYFDISESLEKEIKLQSSSLIKYTEKLSKDIQEFSDIVGELQEIEESLPNNTKKSQLYESVQNCMIKWGAHEEINAKNIEDDFKLHFGYKIKEKPVLKELIKERQQHLANFKKYEHKKHYEELALNLKKTFGHLNHKIKTEIERTIGDLILIDKLHFQKLAENEIYKSESLEALWESTSAGFYQVPKLI